MVIKDSPNTRYFKDCGMYKWNEIELKQLVKGDRFKVYTQVGEPVFLGDTDTFIAASDSYRQQGEWLILIES